MKTILLALLASFAGTTGWSADSQSAGIYVAAQRSFILYKGNDSSLKSRNLSTEFDGDVIGRTWFGLGAVVGWRFHEVWAAEAGYNAVTRVSLVSAGIPGNLRLSNWTLGANASVRLREKWFVEFRGGVQQWTARYSGFGPTTRLSNDSGSAPYAGIQSRWWVARGFGLGVGVDEYWGAQGYTAVSASLAARF